MSKIDFQFNIFKWISDIFKYLEISANNFRYLQLNLRYLQIILDYYVTTSLVILDLIDLDYLFILVLPCEVLL